MRHLPATGRKSLTSAFFLPRALFLLLAAVTAVGCGDTTAPYIPLAERELRVAPAGAALDGAGATAVFRVVDASGDTVPPDSIRWESLGPAVATMDGAGLATAVASGQAVVRARLGDATVGHAVVTVSVPGAPLRRWVADTLVRPDLDAVWGRSDDDIFVVGNGASYHYDGSAWSPLETEYPTRLLDVGGSATGDVFAAGAPGILRYDGQGWASGAVDGLQIDLWVPSAAEAFVVGYDGGIHRYDGSAWSRMESPTTETLEAVWGSASDDVYAAGWDGSVLHYDGASWSVLDSVSAPRVRALWGSGPDDVYLGGNQIFLHYDGQSWSDVTVPTWATPNLWSIAGSSATDVWAAGGLILFNYQGGDWTAFAHGMDTELRGLWLSPSGLVYAVGTNGAVATHSPGAPRLTWELAHVGTGPERITGLWGTSPGDVFATGEWLALRGSAAGWAEMSWQSVLSDLADVWGVSDREVYAVNRRGNIARFNGTEWRPDVGLKARFGLSAVWAAGPDAAFAVGPYEILGRSDGEWAREAYTGTRLYDVWGTSADDIWAVGGTGDQAILWHDINGIWRESDRLAGAPLQGVWGSAPDDVFAVGGGGRIVHFDGDEWSEMTSPATADLHAVWGTAPTDVYAAGDGVVLHYDGSAWSPVPEAPTVRYRAIWGSSAGPVYFGADGRIIAAYR